jgi:hypothetical protein
VRATAATAMANVTIEFDDLQQASISILGLVTTVTHRPLDTFESEISLATFRHSVPLIPGCYRLTIAADDKVNHRRSYYEVALEVPQLDEENRSASRP